MRLLWDLKIKIMVMVIMIRCQRESSFMNNAQDIRGLYMLFPKLVTLLTQITQMNCMHDKGIVSFLFIIKHLK